MVTREEYELYRAALEGDYAPLIDILRSGAELSSEVRGVLAGVLERKLKPPPHRPTKRGTQAGHLEIALHVRELVARDRPVKVAVAEAMAKFNCGKRKVETAVAMLNKKEEGEALFEAQFRAQFVEILSKTCSPEDVQKILRYAEGRGLCAKK